MNPGYTDQDLLRWARFEQEINPKAISLFVAETEAEFVAAVEQALGAAITRMEGQKKASWAKWTEEELRDWLLNALDAGADATPEEGSIGHVDFTIKHRRRDTFVYLGECKIWDGPAYHRHGMRQLLIKYMTGRHIRACCLEFVHQPDMADKMSNLRKVLDGGKHEDQQGVSVEHPSIKGAFVTSHKHTTSTNVEIMHAACNIHESPKKV